MGLVEINLPLSPFHRWIKYANLSDPQLRISGRTKEDKKKEEYKKFISNPVLISEQVTSLCKDNSTNKARSVTLFMEKDPVKARAISRTDLVWPLITSPSYQLLSRTPDKSMTEFEFRDPEGKIPPHYVKVAIISNSDQGMVAVIASAKRGATLY